MKTILNKYINGNVSVTIYDDGTKIREFKDNPEPIHPESIDVKITNYCDANCSFCHEKSTIEGLHGDLNKLYETLEMLPAGVEIAIGGGNPLSHPGLLNFLEKLKAKGIIANITVNQKHLSKNKLFLFDLINKNLIKGLGISYTSKYYIKDIIPFLELPNNNLVFHVIMGINNVSDIQYLKELSDSYNKETKILILGYKNYGFGINYYLKNKHIEDNKYYWYTQLPKYFKEKNLILSFDNLAISQLNLKRFFTPKAWDKFYMGDDFKYTMYIDGVEQIYAPSSTSNKRTKFSEVDLITYFKTNSIK